MKNLVRWLFDETKKSFKKICVSLCFLFIVYCSIFLFSRFPRLDDDSILIIKTMPLIMGHVSLIYLLFSARTSFQSYFAFFHRCLQSFLAFTVTFYLISK